MRRLAVLAMVLLAGCAAPMDTISASQQAVTRMELDYVQKFLVPAAAYDLLPRCPQPAGKACSDAAVIARLRAAQRKLHDAIYALRDVTDAAPAADAGTLLANAQASLGAAEALLPAKADAP